VREKRYIYKDSEDIENIELTQEEIEIGATRLWELTNEERKAIIQI
jgi:hypothetical protein